MLLHGRYHRIYPPDQPETRLRQIAGSDRPLPGPRTDPGLRAWVRDEIGRLVDRIRRLIGRPPKDDPREPLREANRRKVREAIATLRPNIGEEARRRLAAHHVAIIICADENEVQQWYERLEPRRRIQGNAAFVKWYELTLPGAEGAAAEKIVVPLVIWNGGTSMAEQAVYYHELAHLVDRRSRDDRISKDAEWIALWELERGAFRSLIADRTTLAHVFSSPRESFAAALAEAWRNPENAKRRLPGMFQFFKTRNLVVDSPGDLDSTSLP